MVIIVVLYIHNEARKGKTKRTTKMKRTEDTYTKGVELELISPEGFIPNMGSHQVGSPLPDEFPHYEDPNGRKRKYTAMWDSTIRHRMGRNFVTREVVSPVMTGDNACKSIVEMTQYLKDGGCRVNASCGLHVHIGLKSITGDNADPDEVVGFMSQLAKIVYAWQDGLYAQTGTRRDRNRWAGRLNHHNDMLLQYSKDMLDKPKKSKTEEDFRRIARTTTGRNKYKVINFGRAYRFGRTDGQATIEFRFGAGTLNADKIMMHMETASMICKLAWKNRNKLNADPKGGPTLRYDWWSATSSLPSASPFKDNGNQLGRKVLDRIFKTLESKSNMKRMETKTPTMFARWAEMKKTAKRMARKYDNRY